MYPPRVQMTVTLRNPDQILKLPVKFEGCSGDSQLNTDITFPLGNEMPSQSTSPIGSHPDCFSSAIIGAHSKHTQYHESITIVITLVQICPSDDRPKLRDVFKKLLPLANSWKTIGTLLGVESHILMDIKRDEEGVRDCLQAMLSEWLKQVDPEPTWMDIVNAVEEVSSSKAEEIRQHIAR